MCPACSDKLNYRSKKREVKRMKKRQKKRKSSKDRDNSDEGSNIEGGPLLETIPEPSTSAAAVIANAENVGDSLWKKGKFSTFFFIHIK